MATQTVEFVMPSAAVSPLAKIFLRGSDAVVQSVTPVESTNRKGVWTAVFTDAAAGTYTLIGFSSTDPLAVYEVRLTLSTETFYTYDRAGDHVATAAGLVSASVSAPVMPTANILQLVRGDAYDDTSNGAIEWTTSQSVDGKTVNFTVRDTADVVIMDQDTVGVTASASGTTVTLSLLSAATDLLPLGETRFDVKVAMAAGSDWTIARGTIRTFTDYTR